MSAIIDVPALPVQLPNGWTYCGKTADYIDMTESERELAEQYVFRVRGHEVNIVRYNGRRMVAVNIGGMFGRMKMMDIGDVAAYVEART
jgi:hypothetical protein